MKSLLFNIILFFTLLYSLDQIIGRLLEYGFYNQKTGGDYQIIQSITSNRADIVIFGSSRAQGNYNPEIISKITGRTCSNSGLGGGHGIFLPAFQIKEMLKNYTPKIIIIEMDPNSISYWKGDYERLNLFLPFVDKYNSAENLVKLNGEFESLKLFSKTYKYNSKLVNIFIYTYLSNRFKHVQSFIPIPNRIIKDTSIINHDAINEIPDIDSNKVNAILDIINICNSKRIKLLFVNSPYYNNKININHYNINGQKMIENFKKNNIDFIDFTSDSNFISQPNYFADINHLNDIGANLFSKKFAHLIKLNSNHHN
jgi:hypothetical protein